MAGSESASRSRSRGWWRDVGLGRAALLGFGNEGERVAALGELGEHAQPERAEGAVHSGVAQPHRDGVHVGLGRHRVGGVHLASGQCGVAGDLAAYLDPLADAPLAFLPCPDRLGSELHLQGRGLAGELLDPLLHGVCGQRLIGRRRVGVAEAAGVVGDNRRPPCVDETVGHPGERRGKAGRQLLCRLDLGCGFAARDAQLRGQFLAGELAGPAVQRDAACRGRGELGLPAAGELGDHQRLLPRLPVGQPLRRAEHADELVVVESAQVIDRLLGKRGEHRTGAERVRRRALTELLPQ